VLVFNFPDTTYSSSNDDADPKDVLICEIKSAFIDGLTCGGDGKLSEAVHSFAFAQFDVFCYIEVFYFAAERYRICTGVKGFYVRNAAFGLAQRSEKAIG